MTTQADTQANDCALTKALATISELEAKLAEAEAGLDTLRANAQCAMLDKIEAERALSDLRGIVAAGVKFHRSLMADWAAPRVESEETFKLEDAFSKAYTPYWPEIERGEPLPPPPTTGSPSHE